VLLVLVLLLLPGLVLLLLLLLLMLLLVVVSCRLGVRLGNKAVANGVSLSQYVFFYDDRMRSNWASHQRQSPRNMRHTRTPQSRCMSVVL
jgi:hypothetical protein